ncbi:MAG: phosphoribosylformylglycinamidine synthase subunit PurQ [Ignavibacteria bacterium]|nr:phosphoribosylformylglycinamidine synthase subunit PurQ [Bacteroidota bacterium]MSQ46360.1 phosphoribosylformylglycinamidine synthase subunit PurQ [Ignavibacteria bacterium]
MNFGVVVFPGSNCDFDAYRVADEILQQNVKYIWHKDSTLGDVDVIILPGGFSYGDYLRTGAIARFSPVMQGVVKFAKNGGLVIGLCNGFQILTECGLLPGVLMRNKSLKFICDFVNLKVVTKNTPFTSECLEDEVLKIPIAHGDGNYFADEETIKSLKENDQIVFQYCNKNGEVTDDSNPNGAIQNIAGIINKERNVLGMMPHPERAVRSILGSTDGLKVFNSIVESFVFQS